MACVVLACSPVESGPDAGEVPDAGGGGEGAAAIASYCRGVAERVCAGLVACGCNLPMRGLTAETCVTEKASTCTEALSGRVLGDVSAGRAEVVEAEETACFSALEASASACAPVGLSALPPACRAVVSSSAAIGELCNLTGGGLAFCAGGAGVCLGSEGGAKACRALPAVSEACLSGLCAGDAVCRGEVCVKVEAGGACLDDSQCPSTQRCRASGSCAAPLAPGSDCAMDGECADGLACVESKCVARTALGAGCTAVPACGVGRTCERAPETRRCGTAVVRGGTCLASRECAESDACAEGRCVALPIDGDACLPDRSCADGASCIDGESVCRALPGEGETCASGDRMCADGLGCNFDVNQCARGGGDGDPCLINPPDYVCGEGFGCAFESEGSFCRPLGSAGTACGNDRGCGAGTFCDPVTSTCTAARAVGAACETDSACGEGHECAFVAGKSICREIPGNSAQCEERCTGGLACLGPGGVCRPSICGVE